MRRIAVSLEESQILYSSYGFRDLLFFTCIGDEKGLCDTCRVRFFCHTGDIPNSIVGVKEFFSGWYDEAVEEWYDEAVEDALFGRSDLFYVEYDFDTHCKYYNVIRKNEWYSRRQRVKLP